MFHMYAGESERTALSGPYAPANLNTKASDLLTDEPFGCDHGG